MEEKQLQRQLQQLAGIWRKEKKRALEESSGLLSSLAAQLRQKNIQQRILAGNRQDLARLQPDDPAADRLLLNKERLESIAADIENIAALPSPVGQEPYRYTMPNGVELQQFRVPIGLILVIYESRPNVTLDLFALGLRTGNLLLLKGGKEASHSNSCLVGLISEQLQAFGLAREWVNLLGTSREDLCLLLAQYSYIDLCIPRGSADLISFVRKNSQVPVIETGAGVVHLFCDQSACINMAEELLYNSKLRRTSVCNALDCLLLHGDLLSQLPALCARMESAGVQLWCDEQSYRALDGHYSALKQLHTENFGREFLSAQLCIKIVANLAEAIEHIAQYGSQHTEVIVTENEQNAWQFWEEVDAAAVFVNIASGFSDGAQFGLGAEVGISTQKLHARGPMGMEALTCTKWLGRGHGQIRP